MLTSKPRRFIVPILVAAVLATFSVAAAPTNADISNPGVVNFTAVNGNFVMNRTSSSPLSFKYPNLIGPWQCNDGTDNDGDGNVDGADAQCAATPSGATQADDSEALPLYQGQFECNDSLDNNVDYTALPSFVATASGSGTDSVVVAPPTGTASNDIMIAVFSSKATLGTDVADPAGWTRQAFTATTDGSATLYTKVATASEPANYTFSETLAGAQDVSAIIATYRTTGGNPSFQGFAVNSGGANLTSWSYPAITTKFAMRRVVRLGAAFSDAGAQTWTTPNPIAASTGAVRVQSTTGAANAPVSHLSDDNDYTVAVDGTTTAAVPSAIRYTAVLTNIVTGGGIDFLAGAGGAGVPKDTNCGSINDNTEYFTLNPPAGYVAPAFTGTVAANGDVSITSVTQQPKWIHFPTGLASPAVAHAFVQFKYTNLPITGHADPLTGDVILNQVDIGIVITIQGLGVCELPLGANASPQTGWFSIDNLTTGASSPLTGSPYDQTTGVATIVRGDFGLPAAKCASALAETQMNAMLGLPSTSGNDAMFVLKSTPILTSNPAIQGTVTNNAGGAPLSGMKVGLYSASSTGRIATATTDANGHYDFQNLTAGNYRVKVWDPNGTFFTEWNLEKPDYASADNIAAAVGPATVVNFGLEPGAARIQGRVRDRNAANVTPLAGATVTLYDNAGNIVAIDTSGPSGWYDFTSLPAGTYKLKFSMPGYFTEWYQDHWLSAKANAQTVVSGQNLILDFYPFGMFLTRTTNPEISGTVTNQVGGAPISGATVRLYTASGQEYSTVTNGSGAYAFGGIAKHVNYYVRFEAPGKTNEWFNESGPNFDNCAGVTPPCTPTITYADALNWGGVGAFTTVNGTLS